jgi:hypothetical protein
VPSGMYKTDNVVNASTGSLYKNELQAPNTLYKTDEHHLYSRQYPTKNSGDNASNSTSYTFEESRWHKIWIRFLEMNNSTDENFSTDHYVQGICYVLLYLYFVYYFIYFLFFFCFSFILLLGSWAFIQFLKIKLSEKVSKTVQTIVSELDIKENDQKTVKPANLGGIAGGIISNFFVSIFFRYFWAFVCSSFELSIFNIENNVRFKIC